MDALLRASRGLVGVAARSIAAAGEDVTLPQYRVLVLLATRGPQRLSDLAEALQVDPSAITRMVDRLTRKQLVRRHRSAQDRRMVRISLTASGRTMVDLVTEARRAELSAILRRIPLDAQPPLIQALARLAEAIGEPAEAAGWSL